MLNYVIVDTTQSITNLQQMKTHENSNGKYQNFDQEHVTSMASMLMRCSTNILTTFIFRCALAIPSLVVANHIIV